MGETFTPPARAPDFTDRFAGPLARPDLRARDLAALATAAPPAWFRTLFAIRQGAASLMGLKTGAEAPDNGMGFLSDLPILRDEDDHFAVGLADRHLDFRIEIGKTPGPDVAFTTDIWFNSVAGRFYLTAVLPVHRMILRRFVSTLGQEARP